MLVMTANSWIASSLGTQHTTAKWTMTEQLGGGNGRRVGRWVQAKPQEGKGPVVPEMQVSLLPGFERGWKYTQPHFPFLSHTRALHRKIGRAHGVYLGSAKRTGSFTCVHKHTHKYTHPERHRSRGWHRLHGAPRFQSSADFRSLRRPRLCRRKLWWRWV